MKFSRRNILLGGAATLVAVPVVAQGMWSAKDFERPGFDANLPTPPTGEKAWMNWSGAQKATPKQFGVPQNVKAVADLVATAPAPIRPVGTGHSFTGLVPSEGTIVDISGVSGLLAHDTAAQTASLGAGTRLNQAARLLEGVGLGFANMPDIDVQTMAGAFSTATHGTGLKLPAMHDYVQGFQLVTAGGEIKEVSATSNPHLLQAGKVSLGALGVITRYDLKLEKLFNLHRRVWTVQMDEIMDQFEERINTHRNFELLYIPGTGVAAALSHDLHEGDVTGRAASEDEDIVEALQQLRDIFGWWPWLRKQVALSQLPEGVLEDVSDSARKLLSTSRVTKFNEMEYHIPLENGMKTLREILPMVERKNEIFFPVEVRVTEQDDAWLSPFQGGPRMSIALHAKANERYDYLFEEFEPVLRRNGGRPHWGKHHSLSAAELAALYPDFARFNEVRRELDPEGKFVSPYMANLWGDA
ncbi:MAG: D-arabinono-1,4-lactone oxidase [Parvibaculaceae bacterium]|nr:D-arabinono-1,4-lactone oxidase [Parvibaculaceae bacterium]